MHTRLPWQRSGIREKASFGNVRTDGHNIGPDSDPVAFVFYSDRTPELHSETLGNADFIVRAVNSHDALVKALEEIVSPIKFIQERAKASGDEVNGAMAVKLADNAEYLRQIAVRALAQVTRQERS